MDQEPIWNNLFRANFRQQPWANHQAFFQFWADFEGIFLVDFMRFLRLLQPNIDPNSSDWIKELISNRLSRANF